MNHLANIFTELISKYAKDENLIIPLQEIRTLWSKISKAYSQKNRYYHNLSHIDTIYQQLSSVKNEIEDWDMVLFALFYHDYIYKVHKQDNEQKSALCAEKTLQTLGISTERISNCTAIILATKGHSVSEIKDINIFTDADLSILGFPQKKYIQYLKQVRKEYKMYPNLLYNPSRKKVLESFLDMKSIYKTDYFKDNFETQARENIQYEIGLYTS